MTQRKKVLSPVLVISCVGLAAMLAFCEIVIPVKLNNVEHGEQKASISNSLAVTTLTNALAVASAIIDERCLFYCAFERVFPIDICTNRFLRFGMGDEDVQSLADQVYDAFNSANRDEILETMKCELETLVHNTDSAWVCPRKSRAEIIAWLSQRQWLDWFAKTSNRKALFYKLLEDKIAAQKEELEKSKQTRAAE